MWNGRFGAGAAQQHFHAKTGFVPCWFAICGSTSALSVCWKCRQPHENLMPVESDMLSQKNKIKKKSPLWLLSWVNISLNAAGWSESRFSLVWAWRGFQCMSVGVGAQCFFLLIEWAVIFIVLMWYTTAQSHGKMSIRKLMYCKGKSIASAPCKTPDSSERSCHHGNRWN